MSHYRNSFTMKYLFFSVPPIESVIARGVDEQASVITSTSAATRQGFPQPPEKNPGHDQPDC